jgi:hypothetical protein
MQQAAHGVFCSARRILRRLVFKLRFSQGFCGLFESCPLRSKTLVSPGFFAYWANCFGFPAYPCMSMPAGAASSCALPWTLVSRPVSRQSRPRTLVFSGKTGGFVAEVQDSNYLSSNRTRIHCQNRGCRECSRRPSIQDA